MAADRSTVSINHAKDEKWEMCVMINIDSAKSLCFLTAVEYAMK